jgi:hypothetical protein
MNVVCFVSAILNHLNVATYLKDLLSLCMSWFCPPFWWQNVNTWLIFSAFTSTSIYLLANNRHSKFFFLLLAFTYWINNNCTNYTLMCPIQFLSYLGPSSWHILKKSGKKNCCWSISLFKTIRNNKHIWQNIYADKYFYKL